MGTGSHDSNPQPPQCAGCAGELIPTQVESKLFVRQRGDTSGAAWTVSALAAWTCLSCGRTELYACEPGRLVS